MVLPDAALASPDMVTDLLEGGARWHQDHAARSELLVLRFSDKGQVLLPVDVLLFACDVFPKARKL